MKTYNGHRSWNAWNVSLWINNDENMYKIAMDCITRQAKGKKPTINCAIRRFFSLGLPTKTPDGAIYNRLSVKLALEAM